MKNNKSRRKLAKELVKIVKNSGNYDVLDYWLQEDLHIEAVTQEEVIEALCKNLTKTELIKLARSDTEIALFGFYEGHVDIFNDELKIWIELIYLGRLLRADAN